MKKIKDVVGDSDLQFVARRLLMDNDIIRDEFRSFTPYVPDIPRERPDELVTAIAKWLGDCDAFGPDDDEPSDPPEDPVWVNQSDDDDFTL